MLLTAITARRCGILALCLSLSLGCRADVTAALTPPDDDPTDAYAELLARVVTPDGYVDWQALQSDREALDAFVAWLGKRRVIPRGNRASLPYYLDAYNAFILFAVLELPQLPASVLDVPGAIPRDGAGFFLERSFRLNGESVSLWELEHEYIRGRNQDYRIHAALNCASMSCPPLSRRLFIRGSSVNTSLDRAMRRWVRDRERGLRIDDSELIFNPIWEWFERDFRDWSGGQSVCAVAAEFASPTLQATLEQLDEQGCPNRVFDYDWRLNDTRNKPAPKEPESKPIRPSNTNPTPRFRSTPQPLEGDRPATP